MKAFSLLLVLLAAAQWSAAYSPYVRPASGYSSSYSTQSQTSSSSSSSSSTNADCCQLSSWAYGHMSEIRQFANRLRQEYNNMSQGSSTGYSTSYNTPWDVNIINLTGKTATELDALCRRLSEQLVTDMRSGQISYSTISQPNFFEWKSAQLLETHSNENNSGNFQQQQQQLLNFGQFQNTDLSNFDEVKNYAYPSEIKVIDGKTYLVHKNCTEASKTTGDGSFDSPLVTVLKRNRTTTVTSNGMPMYTYPTGTTSGISSGAMITGGTTNYPGLYMQPTGSSSTTTITSKKNIYDWINKNMEPTVINYNPVVSIGGSGWMGNLNTYKPPVHIPVDGSTTTDVEFVNTGNSMYPNSFGPVSTVTISRYNKTTITNPDGTNTVTGSESNKKWIDGKLVIDTERPFGEWSVPRDEAWKREERERFFWFLNSGASSLHQLEEWQRQQEERLLALATRYHTSVEEIQEWHRKELERYRVLLAQYQAQNNDLSGWKRMERGRLDWLIHQNSITREELERWQRENQDRLQQLARQYNISLQVLKNWQIEELNRLYIYFNDQNNSMMPTVINSGSLQISEKERLEELIRQHNATIANLHNSIKLDQKKLTDLTTMFGGNVQDMEKWLKSELERLGGIIKDQQNQMTRITEWQRSERLRLEAMVKQHHGSVHDLEAQIVRDRNYIQSLAAKYHVSIEEIEKWQRAELQRLQNEGNTVFEMNIKEWQARERERLKAIINKNDLTIEEFQMKVVNDRARLEELARTYKVQVSEIEEWIKSEMKNFQSQGLLKEVEKELVAWQQKERDRLLNIVKQNELTVEELEAKIKKDQSYLFSLASTHQVRVDEIEEWLKKELLRLQNQGLIKAEDLKDWQKAEREEILKIVQQNRFTIEDFERKLLLDRKRLEELANSYNVQTSEIEAWIKKEGERLQNMGLLKIREELNNWQKIERDRLLLLINKNNLSIEELQEKIKKDQVHLYSLAHQHQVRVEEIEEWIKNEIKKLQEQGLIEMNQLKDWQTEWRGNLTTMVQERDFTVEEFHKWLLEDRARLQALATQHNVQIEEIEQWVKNEEQRFISLGLLKPNEKLTNWQEMERIYLERLTEQQYHSTEQLEERLRQDRELLEKLARDYSIQVEEVETWIKKELARLRDAGQLQIDNLTAWQIAERERLEEIIKQNKQWSVVELEAVLRKDREHLQSTAFQYHTSVEEIEKWIKSEVDRLRRQGKIDIENLTAWQKTEQQRILNLLQRQSGITVEEFERKVQQDHHFLLNLANQYHISVMEVEEYVKKVIEDLRKKGQFEVGNLQTWQLVERDYIKQLLNQHNNALTTKEFEAKLLTDRAHLRQLADQYRISITQIEKWMVEELQRLRHGSEMQVNQLTEWQKAESLRLKELIQKNNHLSYVEFEVELMKERARLQALANQYSLSVEQIEKWLKQQLLNLKLTGQVEVENLTQWQESEQKRLIGLLIQQQNNISFEEFETQLMRDRVHLQQLASQYSVSIEQIESWMREELQRLKNSGLIQVKELNYWQRIERDRLKEWLEQQHNDVSYREFLNFLKRDKERLQRIAQQYHITVEDVETWVQQEGARLQLLGMIKRPSDVEIIHEFEWIHNRPIWSGDMDEIWKMQTKAHLEAIARVTPMTWEELEQYLVRERVRWEQFARQYNITVEEIEIWLREAAKGLQSEGLIIDNGSIEIWQSNEREYIQNLINELLRKKMQWSIEELERKLQNDRLRLQQLVMQYHLSVEQIEAWYRQELQRLLNQNKIISEHLVDWQRREKERIYQIVITHPSITLQTLEELIFNDRNTLNRLAQEYRIGVEELEFWIREELKRLVSLGLVHNFNINTDYSKWQREESERLHAIVAQITITEEELLQFIAADNTFQAQLAALYGIALNQLAPFQRVVITHTMRGENLFENIELIQLTDWQTRERDRLYNFIKNQNFTLKNLKDWQRQDIYLNEMAAKYGIDVTVLKNWQLREYERLMKLAEYYNLSLSELQDFRDKELNYIKFIMHKKVMSEGDIINWNAIEEKRIKMLQQMTELTGLELVAWRRRLYLLCQGLIPFNFNGGHEIGRGSTNNTHVPVQVISKDRGDQPPNVYDEKFDSEEPGVAGQDPLYPGPNAEMRDTTTARYPVTTVIGGGNHGGGGGVHGGYRYSKKEYQFTVPMGVASASATAGDHGVAASASAGRYGREREMESGGQQQQQELDDDLGQQQQVDLGWHSGGGAHSSSSTHGSYSHSGSGYGHGHGQQQQQVEDFGQQQQVELEDYKHGHYDQGQQQVQVEDLGSGYVSNSQGHASQKQVDASVKAEVTGEEDKPGVWGKIKEKTSSWFG